MDVLDLKLSDAVTLAVPATLQSLTTYVLLEQETWFEKEMGFLRRWLRPGMTAIDIGANLGVYSLPMARLVGQTGQVFAYEPGSAARALLERSRELNAALNLQISPFALSDRAREGRLAFGGSSELNTLGSGGAAEAGEAVHIVSLDGEDAARNWPSPDFVKIDAEGEEERILAGGREFFARHSPLVMFEVTADGKVNERLRSIFPAIGYRLFRQLGGAPILVPDDANQPLDQYELNLFAAKPDRVKGLAQQDLLVESLAAWEPSESACKDADSFWRRQKFTQPFDMKGWSASPDPQYRSALAAYATWRAPDQPVGIRCAALLFALRGLQSASARVPTAARLSTLARIAWEWGARGESVAVLRRFFELLQGAGDERLDEPFWPASPRFDSIELGGQPGNWFAGAAAEQFERTSQFSSVNNARGSPILAWLCEQPFAATEMERRRILIAARAGQCPKVPMRLRAAASDHLNADVWCSGRVPGTIT